MTDTPREPAHLPPDGPDNGPDDDGRPTGDPAPPLPSRRRPRRRRWLVAGVALLALAGGGTAVALARGGDDDPPPPAEPGATPVQVTYLTSFQRFGRDAFVDLAVERGYFAAEGIDIDIKPGTGTDNFKLLAAGTADFAAGDFAGAMLQINGGATGIRAVALLQQRTMAAVMVRAADPITVPSDLAGRTLADAPSSVVRLLFPTYARLAGFDATTVTWVNAQGPVLPVMLRRPEIDGIGQFTVGEPLVEAASGQQVRLLPYTNYLVNLPGNALWTSAKTLRERPELVQRFRRALLRGLAAAMADPAAAGRALAKHLPTQRADVAAAELTLMRPHVNLENLGVLDGITAAKAIAILQGSGAIRQGFTPEQVVALDLADTPVQRD